MKTILPLSSAILLASLSLTSFSLGESITLIASKDAFMLSTYPGANYGDIQYLRVNNFGGSDVCNSFIEISPLSAIPSNATISSAVLRVYVYSYNNSAGSFPKSVALYKVLSSWNESTISYSSQPSIASTPTTTVNFGSFGGNPEYGWLTFDLTSLLQQWVSGQSSNYGVVLKDTYQSDVYVRSSDYANSSYYPRLEVNYTVPTPPVPDLVSVSGVPSSATVSQPFTITVRAENDGGQAPEGNIHVVARYSDNTDDLTMDNASASWAFPLLVKAPGTHTLYTRTGGTRLNTDWFTEAVQTPWPGITTHDLSVRITPQKAGTLKVLVRTTMQRTAGSATDWLNDISADTGNPQENDEQDWECRVYTVTVQATATLTVQPRYAGIAAWDSKPWELLVDGVSHDTTTGDKSITVATGNHTLKGRLTLGSYVAETKDYPVSVSSSGLTKQVWWDKVGITVKFNGVAQTSGYTLKVNNQNQTSPLDHTVLGDAVTNIPVSCTWTGTGEIKTNTISYAQFGGQTTTFDFLVLSIPKIKIMGVVQKAHEDPTATDVNKIGMSILAQVTDDQASISEVNLRWDNLDDRPCLEGIPQPMNILGAGYYVISLDRAFPFLCEFGAGNRIKWRIEAKNSSNAWGYYPSSNSYDTTSILSYDMLRKGLRLRNPGKGTVKVSIIDNNSAELANNKAIALKVKPNLNQLQVGGNFLADYFKLLEAKSFPFGFLEPPTLNLWGFNSIPSGTDVSISISKWGDHFDALVLTSIDFILNISGAVDFIGDKTKKIDDIYQIYNVLKDGYDAYVNQESFRSLTNVTDQISSLVFYTAGKIVGDEQVRNQLIQILGQQVISSLLLWATPINTIGIAKSAVTAFLTGFDFLTSPDQDTVVFANKAGHHVRVDLSQIPGQSPNNPIRLGSAATFNIPVTNLSENQKLYNLWVGFDVLRYDGIKVENTKTDYVDLETGKKGLIDFTNQGITLGRGAANTFTSRLYSFTTSTTQYQYRASRYPYQFICQVWTNGQPGQKLPTPALSLIENLFRGNFFISDDIPPGQPTNLRVISQTDSVATIAWDVSPSDTLDVTKFTVFYGTTASTVNTKYSTIDASMNKGSAVFKKQTSPLYVAVSLLDIGGNEGQKSSPIIISPISGNSILSVTPDRRDVSSSAGSRTFSVSNTGTGTMIWNASVTSGSEWLSISPNSGTNSGTITATYTTNSGTTSRQGTITVTATGASGSPKDVTVTQAGVGATIQPVSPANASGTTNTEFDVFIQASNVTNLFGVSLELNFNKTYLNAVSDASESWFGTDLVYLGQRDNSAGKVSIGVSRKSGQGGVSGTGNVAKVRFKVVQGVTQNTQVSFNLAAVNATDPSNNSITLQTSSSNTTLTGNVVNVWPGDTNNDSVVNQADVLRIGLYWGSTGSPRGSQGCSWEGKACEAWTPRDATYADANGDGIVNQADVLCIGLNWGRQRSSTSITAANVSARENAFSNGSAHPMLRLVAPESVTPNTEFFVDIAAGDKTTPIAGLFGVAFVLEFRDAKDFVEVVEVMPGPLLGGDIVFFPLTDNHNGMVSCGMTRKAGQGVVSGAGLLARVKMRTKNSITPLSLSLRDIVASDERGNRVDLAEESPRAFVRLNGDEARTKDGVLYENHPNPFNPTTIIRYYIPQESDVVLKIYDALGREVQTLVHGKQQPGEYEVRFTSDELKSGVYFCRLRVGTLMQTKKLVLIK